MAKYLIEGGSKLQGEVNIAGNKNAVFPCIAGALLTEEEVILRNIPRIRDTDVMLEILNSLGAEVTFEDDLIKIKAVNLNHSLPRELMAKLRGSIVIVGATLSRVGKAKFSHPGGDIIGKRTIDPHLNGFRELGFAVKQNDLEYEVINKHQSEDVKIFMEEQSVTGTENLILASVLGENTITLKNCAKEPHVVDLCNMLNQMGADILGVGDTTLVIKGKKKLRGTDFTIGPDFIEFGSYAIAAAITRGEIKIDGCQISDWEPITIPLRKMGVILKENSDGTITASTGNLTAIPRLHTNIWPGFPTDLMSLFIVLATQSKGVSLLHDWMYESRMFFVDKLIGMGAQITIADTHRVVVYGPTKLKARDMESPDIRAGMALLLAALIASGKSTINRAELIERGYEDVVNKLNSLGAKIERFD